MAIYKEQSTLQTVIDEAIDIVHGLADARKLQLIHELPATPIVLDLDRIRVRQVLLNLLTNAMRYTQIGWVKICATVGDGEVLITVADSGRGIAPDKLSRAFETFDRLDEAPLKEGSGLGLAISKKFVELHDGRMWIESELGKGTEVHFTLRMPTADEKMPITRLRMSSPLTYDAGKPLILILHSDLRAAELLRRHINHCDFIEAHTFEEAQTITNHELPQAIITDISELHHWQTMLNNSITLSQLPVLSCPLPSSRHLGTLMGATDYLPKPVGRNDLAGALARLTPAPQTVLVIDDDPHIVRLISRMLRSISATLRVLEAFGGEEGLAVVRSQKPDAVFVDLMMPGMSGHKFIEAVRQDRQLGQTPIIVVSVRSVEDETSPIVGEVRLERTTGFSLSELLAVVQSMLATITRSDAISPANAAALLATAAD